MIVYATIMQKYIHFLNIQNLNLLFINNLTFIKKKGSPRGEPFYRKLEIVISYLFSPESFSFNAASSSMSPKVVFSTLED